MYNFNRFEDRMNDHRAFDEMEGFGGRGMNRRHHEPFDPEQGFHGGLQTGFRPGMPPHIPHGMPPQ